MYEYALTPHALDAGKAGMLIALIFFIFLAHQVIITVGYLGLNLIALTTIRNSTRGGRDYYMPRIYEKNLPGVSVILTAYNEEDLIATSVKSLLQTNYPLLEILVVHDGGTDRTMEIMIKEFEMTPYPVAFRYEVPCAEIKAVYRSKKYSTLTLIDKVNARSKADAINAGINLARYPLFSSLDADSVLERDSLMRVMRLFLENPDTIAAGGTVRIVNGCQVRDGNLIKTDLPRTTLAKLQVLEYLRAFHFGRLAWSKLHALLIISGAFGVYRRDAVVSVGGYYSKSLGEDMDLIVRLHKHYIKKREAYTISFVPDPVCWTDAPEDLATLKKQRVRWQRGLLEVLSEHRSLCFNPHAGTVGWLAYPFMVIVEAMGPIMEVLGLIFTLVLYFLGYIHPTAALLLITVSIGFGLMLSASSLLLEERSFHVYPSYRNTLSLFMWAVLENFGYRQMITWWRLIGTWRWLVGSEFTWGAMKRNTSWTK